MTKHFLLSHRIGGNLKLLWESTNADRKRLKIAFSIAYCHFRLPICNQYKTLFDPCYSTLTTVHDRRPSGVVMIFFFKPLKFNVKPGHTVVYRKDPKFSDRKVYANSVDPDQIAPREAVWSGLHSLPFCWLCMHLYDAILYGKATLFKF